MNKYDARKFLHERQDEYQGYLSDGYDEDEAMSMTLDGIADPNLEFALLLASGAMDTAMHAANEEIEEAIRSTNRDYAY